MQVNVKYLDLQFILSLGKLQDTLPQYSIINHTDT